MQELMIENVRLRARKDGIYEVVWSEDGVQKRRSTKTRDVQLARQIRIQVEAEIRAIRVPAAPTIEWLLDAYLADKKLTMKAHNFKTLLASVRPVKARLGALRWDQLTQKEVDGYARQRMTDKRWADHPGKRAPSDKTIGPSTADRDLRILRAALAHALASRHIQTPVQFKINVTPSPIKDVWLTKAEVTQLLDACEPKREVVDGRVTHRRRDREHLYTFILISMASAARKEAALGLTWDRVHLTADADLDGEQLADLMTGEVAGTSYIDFGEGRGNKRRPVMPIGKNFRLLHHLMVTRPTAATEDRYDKSAEKAGHDPEPLIGNPRGGSHQGLVAQSG